MYIRNDLIIENILYERICARENTLAVGSDVIKPIPHSIFDVTAYDLVHIFSPRIYQQLAAES